MPKQVEEALRSFKKLLSECCERIGLEGPMVSVVLQLRHKGDSFLPPLVPIPSPQFDSTNLAKVAAIAKALYTKRLAHSRKIYRAWGSYSKPDPHACIPKAIETALTIDAAKLVTLCSDPFRIGRRWFSFCIQFSPMMFPQHCMAPPSAISIEFGRHFARATLTTCLIYSAKNPFHGIGHQGQELPARHILREAVNNYMGVILPAREYIQIAESLTAISDMKYEGTEPAGAMLIVDYGRSGCSLNIEFLEPIPLKEHRTVRKLLEMSRGDSALIVEKGRVIGIGQKNNGGIVPPIVIRFPRLHEFEVYVSNTHTFSSSLGVPFLPKQPINPVAVEDTLKRAIPSLAASGNAKHLVELIACCASASHGATLVISEDAKSEAERLQGQAIRTVPVVPSERQISELTSIDGAVLIDCDAKCHATGVILDGYATSEGNRARGSRYNSALRYCHNRINCVVVVISEDGGHTILPQLPPKVSRQALTDLVEQLCSFKDKSTFPWPFYAASLGEVDDMRFYLSDDECRRIAETRAKIEVDQNAIKRFVGHVKPFTPNQRMHDGFFE